MWESYLYDINHRPTEIDRGRIEKVINGKLPDSYWKLVCEHQGNTLEKTIKIHDQGKVDFGVLLLVTSPDHEEENYSYCVEFCLKNMRGHYPDGILPFADDTGGNYLAFDFRDARDEPCIVFIDHDISGEKGIVYVAESFDYFMVNLIK